MEKSYIWTWPTRIFHLLLASLVIFMFFSDDDKLLTYHVMAGYLLLILIIFRLAWFVMGPKYSSFKYFFLSKMHVKLYLEHFFKPKQSYFGHNPLASYVMLFIVIVTLLCIFTGIMAYGSEENKGLLSFVSLSLAEDIHEEFSNILLILIIAHLFGVLIDRFVHHENETMKSIITGYKKTIYSDDVKLTLFQKIIALIFAIIFGYLIYIFMSDPNNIFIA